MPRVSDLLNGRQHTVWSIEPQDSVYDAIKLMDEKGIGALAVVREQSLVGIISERDYARKVILKNRNSKDTQVKDIMTRQVYYTFPEQPVEECLAVMDSHHIRHLPVLQDHKLIGMITMGDVARTIIAEQNYKIGQLEHTISWEESY
jgi:CBS domain-containing protein